MSKKIFLEDYSPPKYVIMPQKNDKIYFFVEKEFYKKNFIFEKIGSGGELIEHLVGIFLDYGEKNEFKYQIFINSDYYRNILKNYSKLEIYNSNDEIDFNLLKDEYIAAALSIIYSIKEDLLKNKKIDKIWRTGSNWPDELLDLKINEDPNYNSSDLVIKSGNDYFGLSLKVKKNKKDKDPTLLNKTITNILSQNDINILNKIMEDEFKNETQAFIEEIKNLLPEIKNNIDILKNFISYKSVFNDSLNKKFGLKNFIIPKDIVVRYVKESKDLRLIDVIRKILNNYLRNKNNNFFRKLKEFLLTDENKLNLIDKIYDFVFKPKILNFDFNKINKNFYFYIITGFTNIVKKNKSIEKAEVLEYKTIYQKLKEISDNLNLNDFKIIFKNLDIEEDSTSSIFFDIYLKDFKILELQMRFKGDFSKLSNLSILGNFSKDFKSKILS